MSKLSYEDKIKIYQERKQGNTIKNISKKYGVRIDGIKYLVRLIDKHGFDILRTNKNRKFTSYEKEQIVNRVLLNNESACSVAIDEGLLSRGMLQKWIKDYKNILKDWEIEDIILHPTSDGLKLLLGVTNDAYFNRIIGCYTVLKNAFAEIPAQSKYILDARIDEYRSGKRATEIVVKEIVSSESQIEKLTAQLDEQKNITENLARENEKLKAELAQLNAKTKRTQKASAESGE